MKKALLLFGGMILFFLGAYSLPEGGIPYMKQRTATLGPLELSGRTREKVDMPAWLSWALLVGGAACAAAGGYAKK